MYCAENRDVEEESSTRIAGTDADSGINQTRRVHVQGFSLNTASIQVRPDCVRLPPIDSSLGRSISFGPFRLYPVARVVERDGTRLALGSRALDILIVLTERAGEVVSHKELTRRVWRNLVVSPSGLRVHITGLRKALGEGEFRYIANVLGQGYCFVAPIKRFDSALDSPMQGYVASEYSVRAQYVAIAAGILNAPRGQSDFELRAWATDVVNNYSEIPLPARAAADLKSGRITLSSETNEGRRAREEHPKIIEFVEGKTPSRSTALSMLRKPIAS